MLQKLESRIQLDADEGVIVFNTNRDGNHEIYSMDPDGGNLKNLTNNAALDAIPQVSDDGTKVAFASDRGHPGNIDIWLMDIDGTHLVNITHNNLPGASNWDPAPSPDNSKVLYMAPGIGGGYDIFTSNADGTNPINLTKTPLSDEFASWSDDGTKIIFSSYRNSTATVQNEEIYWMNADGTNQTRVTNNPARDVYAAFTPDGLHMAFTTDRDGNREIYSCDLDGSHLVNLTNNPATDQVPYYSPETGDRISYISSRDGNEEIYVMNADGSAQTRLTNNPAQDVYPGWGETADVIPPAITTIAFEVDTTKQQIRTQFSEGVLGLTESDLTLTNLASNTTISPAAMQVTLNAAGDVATFRFPGLLGQVLPDGNYRASFAAGTFTDHAGHPLSAPAQADFFVLGGDANRDRLVDTQDFNVLAANFGSTAVFSAGDFDYDATVSSTDFDLLISQYAKRLPAAAAAAVSTGLPAAGLFNDDQTVGDASSIELLA